MKEFLNKTITRKFSIKADILNTVTDTIVSVIIMYLVFTIFNREIIIILRNDNVEMLKIFLVLLPIVVSLMVILKTGLLYFEDKDSK